MEKTMARAIYKKMEIGKAYTTSELFDLVGDDYYKYIPTRMQPGQVDGRPVNAAVSKEMWKVVNTGYAKTYTKVERLPLVRGLKYGATPTCFQEYTMRYWVRTK